MFDSVPIWMMILGFILLLGPLVTVHELGHYLVGRMFGVKADAFSVGFGSELAGFTDKRGTRWKLSALPLGGYVQFAGDMNPASQPTQEWLDLPEEERNKTFQAKPLWQRSLIVAAGPVTNLLVAVAIFAAFFMIIGNPVPMDPEERTAIGNFDEKSPARDAGIELGDRIVSIDGQEIDVYEDIIEHVVMFPGKDISIVVERDGEELTFPVTIGDVTETDKFGNEARVGRIGIYSAEQKYESVGPIEATGLAWHQTRLVINMMVTGLGQILKGERSVKELGGPVKIAKYSGESLSQGPIAFVGFVAMISINLAFINLLPIPALDGGHLAFYAIEAVRRKPVGPRGQEWAFRTGIGFVLALMLFVTINDIASLVVFRG